MILIAPPRSGGTWFMQGLNLPYHGEVFKCPAESGTLYDKFSMSVKIKMLKNTKGTAHKIIMWNLTSLNMLGEFRSSELAELMHMLSERDDLYWWTRRNEQAMLVSYLIAAPTRNFHGGTENLKTRTVTYNEFFKTYRGMRDHDMAKHLNFAESFVYEDIVSGAQRPKTLDWDPGRATLKTRHSLLLTHHIVNFPEVCSWMADLNIPGSVSAGEVSV